MKFEKCHTLWLDDALDAKAAERHERSLPDLAEARKEKELLEAVRGELRHRAAEMECPHGDFIASRVIESIRANAPANPRERRLPIRLAWSGVAGLAAAFLLALLWWPSIDSGPRTQAFTEVLEVEAGEPGLFATVLRVNSRPGAAVIWLDGLEHIPESHSVQ